MARHTRAVGVFHSCCNLVTNRVVGRLTIGQYDEHVATKDSNYFLACGDRGSCYWNTRSKRYKTSFINNYLGSVSHGNVDEEEWYYIISHARVQNRTWPRSRFHTLNYSQCMGCCCKSKFQSECQVCMQPMQTSTCSLRVYQRSYSVHVHMYV